jgi:hypothetical protein
MPAPHRYRGRRAATVENDDVRVTVLEEGGHIAEILDKRSGINPLWTPPWPSIEPSTYAPSTHPEYGTSSEAALLAGLIGHNLCVDIFGGPSEEEAAAGLTPHGEASIVRYDLDADRNSHSIAMHAHLALAQLQIDRRLVLRGRVLTISEAVENLTACDRPIGWTQHVTLGPPFLQKGVTEFRVSATQSKVFEQVFGAHDDLAAGRLFDWPLAPRADGGTCDLRRYTSPLLRRHGWRSATSGSGAIFHGSASGRRTTAARTHHGTVRRSPAGWNSGYHRCRSHAAR